MCDIKKELKERARLVRGLANALGYDAEYVFMDTENFDLVCLSESMRETNETLEKLANNLKEMQYLIHLIQRRETREDLL